MSEASNSPDQPLLRLIERGVSLSADKLAKISRTDWNTQTVSINAAPIEEFRGNSLKDETDHVGAFFTMPGGVFLVVFPARSAAAFADAFLPRSEKNPPVIADRERECLAEISNIVVNAVAGAVADACGASFFMSAPRMAWGKKRELLKQAPGYLSPPGEQYTVMAYVHMSSNVLSADCNMFILLNAAWKDSLLTALQ
jgi:chemotaxis protein CheY-P-specific phosphatase CheC